MKLYDIIFKQNTYLGKIVFVVLFVLFFGVDLGYSSDILHRVLDKGKTILNNILPEGLQIGDKDKWIDKNRVYGVIDFEGDLANCFKNASRIFGVKETILRSIAMVESGGHEYAINVNGSSIFFESYESALRFLDRNRKKGSIDVGIMQVNKIWFDRLGYALEQGLDGCFSIYMGALIYAYELQRNGGDIWKAVAFYHSNDRKKQLRYMQKVYEQVKRCQDF